MTQRTDEERSAIMQKCIELEKNGGDVLEYLASQHYISPRATWINFQREMGRKSYEWTNGKPNQERSLKRMKKLTLENKKKAVQIAIDGGDPYEFLRECGSGRRLRQKHTGRSEGVPEGRRVDCRSRLR